VASDPFGVDRIPLDPVRVIKLRRGTSGTIQGFVFEWGLPLRFTMQPKWIALGLFVAGLCLILGAGISQLKHVAIGLAASLL
jgi:hypothetical protein